MQFSRRNIVFLLHLVQICAGQDLDSNNATLLAWRAYGDFVKDYLTAGQGVVQGVNYVYVSPPSTSAVRGGSPVPYAVQNYDLFTFADALQLPTEPLLNPAGSSYIRGLDKYIASADIGGTVTTTPEQDAEIAKRQDAYDAASNKFFDRQSIAFTRWLSDPIAQAAKQSFTSWVAQYDQLYISYQTAMKAAAASLSAYQKLVYGPLAIPWNDDVNNIEVKAINPDVESVGYNMPVYPKQYNVQFNPFNAPQLGVADGITYKPSYVIGGSFQNVCDAWFNGTGGSGQTTSVTWSLSQYSYSDWRSLGYASSVVQGGTRFFNFLSASASATATETSFKQYGTNFQSKVTITLSMKGTPVIFNINSGFWDLPNFREIYPKLTDPTADILKGKVRIQKILLAYQVGITINIDDTKLWTAASQYVLTEQRRVGGGISIFGFRFGAGSSSTYSQSVSSISMQQTTTGGRFVLPPTAPGVTVMLGALGRAL